MLDANDVTEFRNALVVAQLVERGFAIVEKRDENKSPRWDLNPRPQ